MAGQPRMLVAFGKKRLGGVGVGYAGWWGMSSVWGEGSRSREREKAEKRKEKKGMKWDGGGCNMMQSLVMSMCCRG